MNLASFKIFIAVVFLLFGNEYGFPQEQATGLFDDYHEYTDTTRKILPASIENLKIELRFPSEQALDKYKGDKAFDYENNMDVEPDWIAKLTGWINQQLKSLRYSRTYSTALDIFYYVLVILALIIIVWGIIKSEIRFLFFGNSSNDEIKIAVHKEKINQIDFDELISTAVKNRNYKLAVRYLFLKSLKLLSDREIILLKKDKTNNQYLTEIKNKQLALAFKDALSRFEWIWYGDFPVDEKLMENSENEFNRLAALIRSK